MNCRQKIKIATVGYNTIVPRHNRFRMDRLYELRHSEDDAAIKIQALVRGRQGRKEYVKFEKRVFAATDIQRIVRGALCRY